MTSSRIHVVEVSVTSGWAIEDMEAINKANENIADAVRNPRVVSRIAHTSRETGNHIRDRFGRCLRLTMKIPQR